MGVCGLTSSRRVRSGKMLTTAGLFRRASRALTFKTLMAIALKECVNPYDLLYMLEDIIQHIESLEEQNASLSRLGIQSTEDMHETTEG